MAFACQRDSYQTSFASKVVSCEPATLKIAQNGKKNTLNGFNIIFEDTILFPEGGGQPDDRGSVNGKDVFRVTRNGTKAVHFLLEKLEEGDKVDIVVDWKRRFDHMQQHSGQHLITAVADKMFGFSTTSWNLGEIISSIELNTPTITQEQISQIEDEVNKNIRERIPVTVEVYEEGAEELKKVRTRGLPDDHKGPVRIITINGIESNMCCGTHVKNLADLQMIKLLYAEKGKKNKINLFFIAGNRILAHLEQYHEREKQFTTLLKNGPQQHVELIDKMQKSLKLSLKNELNLLRDLAVMEAAKIKTMTPKPKFHSLHRKEGTQEFMNIIVNEVNDDTILLFLTVGDDRTTGQVTLSGPKGMIAILGPSVGEMLEGKGAVKGSQYQGKVNNMAKRSEVEKYLISTIDMDKKA